MFGIKVLVQSWGDKCYRVCVCTGNVAAAFSVKVLYVRLKRSVRVGIGWYKETVELCEAFGSAEKETGTVPFGLCRRGSRVVTCSSYVTRVVQNIQHNPIALRTHLQ